MPGCGARSAHSPPSLLPSLQTKHKLSVLLCRAKTRLSFPRLYPPLPGLLPLPGVLTQHTYFYFLSFLFLTTFPLAGMCALWELWARTVGDPQLWALLGANESRGSAGGREQSRAGSLGAHRAGQGIPRTAPPAARLALLPRHPARLSAGSPAPCPPCPGPMAAQRRIKRPGRRAAQQHEAGQAARASHNTNYRGPRTTQTAARSRAGSSGKERRSRGSAAPALGLWARGARGRQERRALPPPGGTCSAPAVPAEPGRAAGKGWEGGTNASPPPNSPPPPLNSIKSPPTN